MNRLYIIVVDGKPSQDGYKTLKEAQDFCAGRTDRPEKISDYKYSSDKYEYLIYDITIG